MYELFLIPPNFFSLPHPNLPVPYFPKHFFSCSSELPENTENKS